MPEEQTIESIKEEMGEKKRLERKHARAKKFAAFLMMWTYFGIITGSVLAMVLAVMLEPLSSVAITILVAVLATINYYIEA